MSQLAIDGSRTKSVRLLALDLVAAFQQKDFVGEVAAIGAYVRDRVRYVRDIRYCETIQTPVVTLQLMAGDCDDKATLSAALLMAIGNTCRFVAVDQGKGFCHVWTQVLMDGKWVNIETTEPVPVGNHSRYLQKKDRLLHWPIEPNELQNSPGMVSQSR